MLDGLVSIMEDENIVPGQEVSNIESGTSSLEGRLRRAVWKEREELKSSRENSAVGELWSKPKARQTKYPGETSCH
jgi:hypothetical protein